MALHIYGVIGSRWDELDAASVKNRLAFEDEDSDLDIYINSPGGDVFAGIAIMSMVKRHKGKVTAHIDGLAASAATVVMLGADEIRMPANAMLMVHNPWMVVAGDYQEMAKASEDLEKIRDAMLAAYRAKTGKSDEELKALLDDETWMTAEEALEHGFIDAIDDEVVEAVLAQRLGTIDFTDFKKAPEALTDVAKVGRRKIAAMAARSKGADMGENKNTGSLSAPVQEAPQAQVVAVERPAKPTLEQIEALCSRGNLEAADILAIAKSARDMNHARDLVIDALATKTQTPTFSGVNASVTVSKDAADKFKEGAVDAILMRGGLKQHDTKNSFRGMSLMRLAEESVIQAGGRPDYTNRESLVKQSLGVKALGGHSRSDFPEILKDAINKSVLIGHEQAGETWQQWCRTKALNDFREAPMVGLSAFDALEEVAENGEYKYGSISERGERIKLATFGKLLRVSRQMIVDDNLDQLTEAPRLMGLMAAQVPGDLAYGVLTDNANLNETGQALFSATHSNTFNDVLGYAGLDALVTAMRTQTLTSPDGSVRRLNISPQYLIVPPQLEVTARELMASTVTSAQNQANTFANRFQIIVDNRLGDAAAQWYLAASPFANDTVVVGFLDGNPTPFVEEREMFDVDAIEFKIRLDCAAAAAGYRGLARGGDGT